MRLDPRAEGFADLCRERGRDAWLVGGFVRDRLLGRSSDDVDVAVAWGAAELAFAYADASRVPCVRLHDDPPTLRLVFAAVPGSAPRLVLDVCGLRGTTIGEDLAGRDFTCNAMALQVSPSASEEPLDPLGGEADLRSGALRMASPRAFAGDPLRLIRAFRFAGELGLRVEADTQAAIAAAADRAAEPAGERIRDELLRVLALPGAADLVRQMSQLGVLGPLLGLANVAAGPAAGLLARYAAVGAPLGAPADEHTRLAVLLHGASDEGLQRLAWKLRLSAKVTRAIRAMHRVADGGLPLASGGLERPAAELCADLGGAALSGLVLRAVARPAEAVGALALAAVVARVVLPRLQEPPLLSGLEVIELTGAQGAEVGRLLRSVRVAQLAGELEDAEGARAWVGARARS